MSTKIRKSVLAIKAMIAILCLYLVQISQAQEGGAVRYVNAGATGDASGTSWENAYPKLQDALAAASSDDEIWVAKGVYYPDEGDGQSNNNRNSTFTLVNGVAIYGGFVGTESELSQRDWENNETILSGDLAQDDDDSPSDDNAYHVVTRRNR